MSYNPVPPLGQALMSASEPVVIASNQSAVPVSAASLPLPTGAATAALQTQPGVDIGDVTVNNAAGASAVNIQDGGNSITVDGTITANAGSGTMAVSAASLPLPTGAATAALQTQPGVDIGDVTVNNAAGVSAVNIQDGGNSITVDGTVAISGTIPVSGNVTVINAAGASAVNIQDGGNSITVDGTVTANAGSGTFAVSAASLPLPTGAATAALQTQPGVDIGDVTVNNAAGASAVNIQDGGNSITVDGTVAISGTVPVSAASLPLPTGAATSALQTQPGVDIGDVTVNNAAGASAVNIQDGGNSITVDGTTIATLTDTAATGTLTANGDVILANPGGGDNLIFFITGTLNGTTNVVFSGSADGGTQYEPLEGVSIDQGIITSSGGDQLSLIRDNLIWFPVPALTHFKATFSGITSGTSNYRVAVTSSSYTTICRNLGLPRTSADAQTPGRTADVWANLGLYNGTNWNRGRSVINATNSVGLGIAAVGNLAQFDDVAPTSITENQFGNLRMSANRNLYGTIRDAAGNERGVNVNSDNTLNAANKELPDATSTYSPTNSTSTAYEASRIAKASAGTLYSINGYNSKATDQFIQVHNTTTLPADTAVPVVIFIARAQSNFSYSADKFGRFFSTGITICNSSTGPTKTIGSADVWLDCQFS